MSRLPGGQKPLPLNPSQEVYEPAHGMLVKAAELNVRGAAEYFRALLGNRKGRLVTSIDPRLVAEFCRVDGDMLVHASPTFESGKATIMGQHVGEYSIKDRRWCPMCLAENGAHRTWWDVPSITSCPEHRQLLQDSCACGKKTIWARSASLMWCSCGAWLKNAEPERPDFLDCRFDAYLIARFMGQSHAPVRWLDDYPMHEAIKTVRILGEFILEPFQERGLGHSTSARHRIMAAGFDAIANFPARIESTLADIYAKHARKLKPPHRMNSYEFRVWLTTGSETPMKKAIRRAIRIRTRPDIEEYDIPYGYFAAEHAGYLCSFNPAALMVVLRRKRPKFCRQPVGKERIDPETMAWLVRHVGSRVKDDQVAGLLDIPLKEIIPLGRAGFVRRFVDVPGYVYDFYSPLERHRFMHRVIEQAGETRGADSRFTPLPHAARELDVPVAELVREILEGRLESWANGSARALGLSRVLVDIEAAAGLRLARWER